MSAKPSFFPHATDNFELDCEEEAWSRNTGSIGVQIVSFLFQSNNYEKKNLFLFGNGRGRSSSEMVLSSSLSGNMASVKLRH